MTAVLQRIGPGVQFQAKMKGKVSRHCFEDFSAACQTLVKTWGIFCVGKAAADSPRLNFYSILGMEEIVGETL